MKPLSLLHSISSQNTWLYRSIFVRTPDLPFSSYRTLIYVMGFLAFDFNLSMSVLQYCILPNSWDLTLFSACSNFIFSMSFWYIWILHRINFTDVSYVLLWLSLGHCCQVDSHLNWINKCAPLFMACFVLFVWCCDIHLTISACYSSNEHYECENYDLRCDTVQFGR